MDRAADGEGTEVEGFEFPQRAAEAPDGGAGGGENNYLVTKDVHAPVSTFVGSPVSINWRTARMTLGTSGRFSASSGWAMGGGTS